jgi:hypothetical protein
MVELTVGRHSAGGGVGVDPIVAAALSRRPTLVAVGGPRHCDEPVQRQLTGSEREGALGWPGEPHDGTGLGWPVDLLSQAPAAGEQRAAALVPDGDAPVRRRLDWRRIFGGGPATGRGDGNSGTSAA